MEYQNRKEAFRQLLIENTAESVAKLRLAEIDEQADEFEEELLELSQSISPMTVKRRRLRLPENDDVISWDLDAKTPLSRFRDQEWFFRHPGEMLPIRFGMNHQDIGVDLSDPNAAPLRRFQKYMIFYAVPGKNIYSKITKPSSTVRMHNEFLHFMAYLFQNGYLLGSDGNFKTLETLDVKALRAEIRARMKRDEVGPSALIGFCRSIGKWIILSKGADLPKEFLAPFTEKDFWGGGLSKEIARYKAEKSHSWEAIDFDNLQPMLKAASRYIQLYAHDLLYLERKYFEAHRIKVNNQRKKTTASIEITYGPTTEIAKELLNYNFAICPETHKPWFELSSNSNRNKKRNRYSIAKKPILEQWQNLIGAAIFMLFLWTAMRVNELQMLEADALLIDGEPMDLNRDVTEQVDKGQRFDLRRTVFKTEENLLGEDHILPLPKIGAQAFSILFELFRISRESLNNNHLLPAGGLYLHGTSFLGPWQTSSDPISKSFIGIYFYNFCYLADVERQHPHKCRKTLATLMINYDPSSLELIRDILCHKSVAMTVVYLMSLPGVAEDILNHIVETQKEKVAELLADGAEGKLAGAAGNRTLDAIAKHPEAFHGTALATTVKTLLEAFTENANFDIILTPAAWCLRFPSKVPWTAPCLPPNAIPGEYIYPDPGKCIPFNCKHAGHSTRHLDRIKGALAWAKKAASESRYSTSKAHYEEQIRYWEDVVNQLENGRPDIVSLNIVEQALAFGGR